MDGVVLCADTQETVPGYTKTTTEKIAIWEEKNFTIAVTGAGDSEIVEALSQLIIEEGRGEYTPGNSLYGMRAKHLISDACVEFFNRHLLPYPKPERPFVEHLVAIQSHHNRYLLKVSGNIVLDLDPSISTGAACIGSGALLASSLIERFYDRFSELDDLVIVSCYVIFQAKRWVDGCGGNTDLLVLTDRLRFGLSSEDIEHLEELFQEYDDQCGRLLTAIANPNASLRDTAQRFAWMRRDLLESRKELLNEVLLMDSFKPLKRRKRKL